ncbi:MAG: hypothetical protein DRR04_13065 [Gammaproteobacteria bacterium]|nr:MAG: hypothetical protein DRR04_13065 [Gammaproteobacteria bacterium]
MSRFDKIKGHFTKSYRYNPNDSNSIISNTVNVIHERQDGRFWVGTSNGMSLFNPETEKFKHFTEVDGLPNNYVKGILEDDAKRLWISTNKGLSLFNPETKVFRNYDISDGIQSNEFLQGSFTRGSNGEYFFGGMNGFSYFYPDKVKDNPYIPPIRITDFQLFNKSVPIRPDSILTRAIWSTDHIVLSPKQNIFSLEFASLSYRFPKKNRYRYKLAGLEKNWNKVNSKRRYVTYTNLEPGEYVFRVQGSNNDGVWNEEGVSIKITITPPWWETAWFRIGMMVLAMSLLVGGYRRRLGMMKARSRELEAQVQERTQDLEIANKAALEEREDAETANRAKSTFLSNMSHELRTPLSAILGFARLMTRDSGLDKEQQERLDIINRSGEHLLGMVDDILSMSKIEAGRIELHQDRFDVSQMLQDVGKMIKSRAEGKGLRLTLDLDTALPPHVQGDVGKLRQILINLLGNAVKFTETGDVWLRARSQPVADDPDMVMLRLEVEDSGPGIPQDRLNEVFDTFVQLDRAQNTEGGTGLGLAISKTLVGMMDGEITVESELGVGTLFTIIIPFHLAEAGAATPSETPVAEVTGLTSGQPDWRILVVDDNKENRLLLWDLLSHVGFNVQEARDGEEAITKYKEWRPHFIWMDMRMPGMDGYAATRKIRELPGGSEVKIVAVTASVLTEHRAPILASGCNDLVRKPFRSHQIFDAMARYLGVEYLYGERERETGRDKGAKLTPEMLAELPRELLQELRGTTLSLDREATLQVIARIEAHAPEAAEGLRILVQDFQMGRLGELLEKTESRD